VVRQLGELPRLRSQTPGVHAVAFDPIRFVHAQRAVVPVMTWRKSLGRSVSVGTIVGRQADACRLRRRFVAFRFGAEMVALRSQIFPSYINCVNSQQKYLLLRCTILVGGGAAIAIIYFYKCLTHALLNLYFLDIIIGREKG